MLVPQNRLEEITLQFMEDWSKSDPDLLTRYFTADGYYRNIPAPTARGHEAVRELIKVLFDQSSFRMENLNIASRGNTVFIERIDYLTFADDRTLPLPVFGVLDFEGDLIKEWREYFDLGTVEAFGGIPFRE